MAYRILMIGGASGGHAMPLLAVGEALSAPLPKLNLPLASRDELQVGEGMGSTKKQYQAPGRPIELYFLGEKRWLEAGTKARGWQLRSLVAGKLRGYFSPLIFLDYLKMFAGFWQALWRVFWIMPDAVFSKGGYDSIFPALWAKIFFIPLYIHETDSVPGRANRLLSKFAKEIFVAFPGTASYFPGKPVAVVGNPIRSNIFQADPAMAREHFKLLPDLPTVLILGGSQGARNVNNAILSGLVEITKEWQIIHLVGENNLAEVNQAVTQIVKEGEKTYGPRVQARHHICGFLNESELAQAYAVADVVITRGGGALFEISALGKPAIVIPIADSANGHQLANAMELAKYGAVVLTEDNLTTHILLSELKQVYVDRQAISQKIKAFAPLDAADKIAVELLSS